MKLVKKIHRYCPKCKKHTEQSIVIPKKKERGSLKKGSIARAMKRGLGKGAGNKGRWGSKPSKPKRMGQKASKKTDFRFKCTVCGKSSVQRKGFRAKKIEFI